MGPSGSGKSTLMHTVAGLDTLTSGTVYIGDTDLATLDDKRLTQLRRDRIGFIFQAFNLVPTLTALENITLPMRLAGRKPDQAWFDHVVAAPSVSATACAPPERALGRTAAARRRGPGAGQPSRRSSSPTSPPATSTPAPAPRSSTFMRTAVRELGQTIVMVTHDPVAASLRRPGRLPRRRPDRRRACHDPTPDRCSTASSSSESNAMFRTHPQEPPGRASCASSPPPRRHARRRLHGRHARAHRHHRQDVRQLVRQRQRRHQCVRPRRNCLQQRDRRPTCSTRRVTRHDRDARSRASSRPKEASRPTPSSSTSTAR